MTDLPLDPAATRVVYERQWALLIPVVNGLRDAATAPSPLIDDDWRGATADAAREFLRELRAGLQLAAESVDDAAADVRHQILDLS